MTRRRLSGLSACGLLTSYPTSRVRTVVRTLMQTKYTDLDSSNGSVVSVAPGNIHIYGGRRPNFALL